MREFEERAVNNDAYLGLNHVYDKLMDDVDYDAWFAYYQQLLSKYHPQKVGRLADLACGTGQFGIRFSKLGIEVTGLDRSEGMLARAGEAARKQGAAGIRFVRGDLRSFSLPRKADAILCACDGINYLTKPEDVQKCFACVAQSLRPGGVFLFDISSRYKLEHHLGNEFCYEEREDTCLLWQNHYDPQKRLVEMDITLFIQEKGDLFRRYMESHIQRAHEAEEICRWLEEAGFGAVDVYGNGTLSKPREEEIRLHFVAVMP